VTSTKYKEWGTNLVSIICEESYPAQPKHRPISDELTLCLDTKEDVEKFIALIRKATRNIK